MNEFGLTYNEIKNDPFTFHIIDVTINNDNKGNMIQFIGTFLQKLLPIIKKIEPDIILLLGDRGEMLAGAMVVGLPLAPFNRVRKMMIDYFRHKFGAEGEFLCYTLPAINRSLQALGRVLRTFNSMAAAGFNHNSRKTIKSLLDFFIVSTSYIQ
jgi:hypothetical protein